MRNASDIFCLNDEGTDGMQMFSVNGSCPMKIKRRHQQRENECFEYGRQMFNSEQSLGRGDAIPDKLEAGKAAIAQEMAGEDSARYAEVPPAHASPKGDQKRDAEIEFHKLSQASGSKERVTTSTIMRNPLTGAGMEIEEHRKPKKGAKGSEKWVW